MSPVMILAYLVGCLIAGWLGKNSRIGFLGSFMLSAIFTPLLTLLAILLFGPPRLLAPPAPRTVLSRSERARSFEADP